MDRFARHLYTKELSKLHLGYVHIMGGLAFGFHQPGEPMTLAEFRAHCDGIITCNCGHTEEDAEKRLAEDVMDIAAFGRPFITNPDLVTRLPNSHPLTPFEDMS